MNNEYPAYSDSDIEILIREPWEISDQPYRLHAAFALSNIFDMCGSDEESEDEEIDRLWGAKIPRKILDRLVLDIKDDFNDAASNRTQIRIWGRQYSIRKVNAYDHNRLHKIFQFPIDGEDYIITKDGVKNLSGSSSPLLKPYTVTPEQARKNRIYLRQIIMLAEDDKNNGWDKLTDMEIVLYCWALFYNKHQYDNFLHFKKDYKDYIYVSESDIIGCLNEKASLGGRPIGMYTFSYDKVQKWNINNNQKSYAEKIPESEAEDYWYEHALKTTFKPIDF